MSDENSSPPQEISPRRRVQMALEHRQPDRTPVDFLATNEIWDRLIDVLQPDATAVGPSDYFQPEREALLRQLQIDCRLLSYDMFCAPPPSALQEGAQIAWWDVQSRSTPNRMWRQRLPNGDLVGIFGRHWRVVEHVTGSYEESAGYPLASYAGSVDELQRYPWPSPDWWDFTSMPGILEHLDRSQEYHIRFRLGSVFEVAWQLRGMSEFLMEMAMTPQIPFYIMERLTDIYVELLRRVLEVAGDRLDMVYFYDDIATQQSLMVSQKMWRELIRPHHARIIELCDQYDIPVMYHTDGSIYRLIPELIEMGIDVLNPVQTTAKGMEPEKLKAEFGDRLTFHGGIDIMQTLPRGSEEDVRQEVRYCVDVLGKEGGYILASSHHIQPDTPIENVLAMYEPDLRQVGP